MRNSERNIFVNNTETYEKVVEDRRVPRGIRQFSTPKLNHLDPSQVSNLQRQQHIWAIGDRYYKLAYRYYGNPKMWWVIAWYNRRPTESHVNLGDLLYIPTPLEDVLRYFGV